jgi:hypothetical protein
MVIIELAYKFLSKDPFTILPIQGHSGSFDEKPSETNAGDLYTTEIKAYLPVITKEKDEQLKLIRDRKAIFKATDSAGLVYIIGDDIAQASLTFDKINEGKPGSKHGYQLTISLKYSYPSKIQVL